jgi:serine/threonine protein kinase/outer membrane protein assembly factor BamB
MPADNTAALPPTDSAAELVRVLDDYLAALQAGRPPDRVQLLADHPEIADRLDSCLAALDFIHTAERPAGEAPPRLGDFRIVREIGRGGMGVVYEAEQLSLKRRVALKVLRFGAVADEQAMARFQREAETVARLHHTNIVPVYAVGAEGGVHYYAMQFIDGVSLDQVSRDLNSPPSPGFAGEGPGVRGLLENPPSPPAPLPQSRERGELSNAPLRQSSASRLTDFCKVARWGLQAAEALAHAHARGVIHRDIKPSNLLLDAEGTVWLTDFGLAKRADEVTLTAAGALLGTPRYMSPEQASAVEKPVDHRSDIYSLGATLYELATGRPVFDADTPQKVIAQILDAEPAAPRRVRPDLPRDLETVLLKCLAKEPDRRYQSAGALADDLRRFAAGDPVKARRPTAREQAARWVKRHRRSLTVGGVAAVVAAAMALGGVAAEREHAERQLGQVMLTTLGPALKAEILDDADRPAAAPFTVPAPDWLALPAGDYRVRLSRTGALSEVLSLTVTRGGRRSYAVELGERQMVPPVEIGRQDRFAFVNLNGLTDLIVLEKDRGLRRLAGGTGQPVWEVVWGKNPRGEPLGSKAYGLSGDALGLMTAQPHLLEPPPDVNGDSTRDLVWAGRFGALALSGADCTTLWYHAWSPKVPEADAGKKLRSRYSNFSSAAVGQPVGFDVDGDGVSDLIAAVVSAGQQFVVEGSKPEQVVQAEPQSWVEAVSGKTGATLWRHPLAGRPVPNSGQALIGPAELVALKGRKLLLVLDGPRLLGLDPATGTDVWPAYDLGGVSPLPHADDDMYNPDPDPPSGPVQRLDLDGDGFPDVALVNTNARLHAVDLTTGKAVWPSRRLPAKPLRPPQLLPGKSPALLAVFPKSEDHLDLAAFDWADGRERWRTAVRATWPPARPHTNWDAADPAPGWPVVADFADGVGIAVPSRPSRTKPLAEEKPGTINIDLDEKSQYWAGVAVLDAATGAVRWQRKLPAEWTSAGPQIDALTVGPDVDGDGRRDLFVASFAQSYRADPGAGQWTHRSLFVTALSGADGRTLWWWRQQLRIAGRIEPLQWGPPGPDGHPLLVVPFNSDDDSRNDKSPSATYLLAAADGRLVHVLPDVARPRLRDLDGDGVDDVYALVHPPGELFGGKKMTLSATRGTPAEAWRRLGKWAPVQDLDGDGVADAVSGESPGEQTVAVSGRDGHELWRSVTRGQTFVSPPLPLGDLDGDGVPDLISNSPLNRVVLSGRTGRVLWPPPGVKDSEADLKPDGVIGIAHWSGLIPPTVVDLRGDGRPAVLYAYSLDFGDADLAKMDQREKQLWLAAVDGRTGGVLWRRPLGDRHGRGESGDDRLTLAGTADLTGSGRDLVFLASRGPGWAVLVLRGSDGSTAWEQPLTQPRELSRFQAGREPVVLLAPPERPDDAAVFVVERQFDILEKTTREDGGTDKREFRVGPSCYRVRGLRGKDGRPAWEYRLDETPAETLTMGNAAAVPWNHRAVLARLPGVGPAVCVYTMQDLSKQTWGRAKAHFVVLDRDGKERQSLTADTRPSWFSGINIGALAACDLDGDGFDELLWVLTGDGKTGERLYATRGGFDRKTQLWDRPVDRDDCIAQFLPGGKDRGSVVFVYDRQLKIEALDGRTGRPLGTYGRIDLAPPSPGTTPRVFVPLGDSTACRVLPGGPPELPAAAPSAPPDPRLRLDLPWAERSTVAFHLTSALYGLLLLALPAGLLYLTVRRRSWRWGLVLLAYVGLLVAAHLLDWFPKDATSFDELFTMIATMVWAQWITGPLGWIGVKSFRWHRAVLGLPLLAVAAIVIVLLVWGRWRRLGLLAVAVPALAAGAAAVLLWTDDRRYDPAQYYDWSGWYMVLGHGAYLAGGILLPVWLLRGLWAGGRRVVRLIRPGPAPTVPNLGVA